jgi:hypothetical protein
LAASSHNKKVSAKNLSAAAERDSDIGHIQKGTIIIVIDSKGGGASRTALAAFVLR